jgi:hypothetical protein
MPRRNLTGEKSFRFIFCDCAPDIVDANFVDIGDLDSMGDGVARAVCPASAGSWGQAIQHAEISDDGSSKRTEGNFAGRWTAGYQAWESSAIAEYR